MISISTALLMYERSRAISLSIIPFTAFYVLSDYREINLVAMQFDPKGVEVNIDARVQNLSAGDSFLALGLKRLGAFRNLFPIFTP